MNHSPIHKHREYSYLRAYKAPLQLSRTLYKSALFSQNKPNFKKAQMNVNSVLTKDYDDIAALRLRKNKPNSKPNKSNQTQPVVSLPALSLSNGSNLFLYPTGPPSSAPNPHKSSSQCSLLRRISTISGCCFSEILLTNRLTLCRKNSTSIACS